MSRPLSVPGYRVAGRYQLQSQIGGGGMGAVWLALDERLSRTVAVKQVFAPLGANTTEADQLRERALREGRIAARLIHPHAVAVFDVALEDDQPWLVMEYLPSRSLATVLVEDGPLRVDQVAQIGAQVADALNAAHAAGIVHRDVKPSNILIGRGSAVEGLVKITDFGISHANGDVTVTQTGQITGTPAYLAPEVAQGRPMTPASDVFSLGATLYACLEGQPPFGTDDNALAMLHRVAGAEISPPQHAGALTAALMRMLAPDPDERPTMAEVRDELARLAAGQDGDTNTVLLGRTDLRPDGPLRTTVLPAVAGAAEAVAASRVAGASATGSGAETSGAGISGAGISGTKTSGAGISGAGASRVAAPSEAEAGAGDPPQGAPPPTSTSTGGGRSAGRWLAVGVLAVVLAGLIVFWLTRPGDLRQSFADGTPSRSPAASSTTSSTPAASSTAASSPPAATTSAPATSPAQGSAPPPAAQGSVTAGDIRGFLRSYHELALTDPRQAYAETGPTLQSHISYDSYARFWAQFTDVKVSDVEPEDGTNVATADLEYRYADGRKARELHRFTFVAGGDGRLLLDADERIGD